MSKITKTLVERLDEMIALNTSLLEEIRSMHSDLNKSNTALIEKETKVEVLTSTAEEIKEALSPIMKRIAKIRG